MRSQFLNLYLTFMAISGTLFPFIHCPLEVFANEIRQRENKVAAMTVSGWCRSALTCDVLK